MTIIIEQWIQLIWNIWRCKRDTSNNLPNTNNCKETEVDLNTIRIEYCNIDRARKSYTRTHIKIGSNDCVDIIILFMVWVYLGNITRAIRGPGSRWNNRQTKAEPDRPRYRCNQKSRYKIEIVNTMAQQDTILLKPTRERHTKNTSAKFNLLPLGSENQDGRRKQNSTINQRILKNFNTSYNYSESNS